MDAQHDPTARLIEWERAQIGNEIHDALLPLIFAASASLTSLLEQIDDDPVELTSRRERLGQIAEWLDDAMRTGRRILTDAYPPELADTTWTNAATTTLERLLGTDWGLLRWRLAPGADQIAPDRARTVYRIVVEAVRNATRHGKAETVTVSANRTADQWQLDIVDDGCGFDPDDVPADRFGLRSMRARAELIGGKLAVRSNRGGPTTVSLTFGV